MDIAISDMIVAMRNQQWIYGFLIALFVLILVGWVAFTMQGVLIGIVTWISPYEWLQAVALIIVVAVLSALVLGNFKAVKRNTFPYVMLTLSSTYVVLVGSGFVYAVLQDLTGTYCSGFFGTRTSCVSGSWWTFMTLYLPIGLPLAWMTLVSLGYFGLAKKRTKTTAKSKPKSRK